MGVVTERREERRRIGWQSWLNTFGREQETGAAVVWAKIWPGLYRSVLGLAGAGIKSWVQMDVTVYERADLGRHEIPQRRDDLLIRL